MPTFVYLPDAGVWINLNRTNLVRYRPDTGPLTIVVNGEDAAIELSDKDREVFLKALSQLTPKELT